MSLNSKTVAEWREEGNRLYKEYKYVEALECYNNTTVLDPDNPVHYTNRAAVYCALLQGDRALKDAEKSIELDPSWIKGYQRKGRACIIIGKKLRAIAAFKEGLKIEPENDLLLKGLEEANAMADEVDPDPEDIPEPDCVSDEDRAVVDRILHAKTYYEVLDIDPEFTNDEIKSKYRRLALQLHPDKNKAKRAQDAFKKVNEANATLTNPIKKTLYDRYMSQAKDNPEQQFHEFEADPMEQLPGWVRCLLKLPGGGLCLLCGFAIITIPLFLIFFIFLGLFIGFAMCAACICPCCFPNPEEQEKNEAKEAADKADAEMNAEDPDLEAGLRDESKHNKPSGDVDEERVPILKNFKASSYDGLD